jgi:hypothetical protein
MPNIFNVSRMALMALILLSMQLLFNSCAKGKGTSSESLYGEIKAVQGAAYTVLIQEYVGISPLYVNCVSQLKEGGHTEHTNPRLSTNCTTEISTYCYAALIPVEKEGQYYYLPLTVRSYVPIQLSDYVTETIGNVEYSRVAVEARQDISQVPAYRGHGDFTFIIPGYETPEEERTHLPNSGEGDNDRP